MDFSVLIGRIGHSALLGKFVERGIIGGQERFELLIGEIVQRTLLRVNNGCSFPASILACNSVAAPHLSSYSTI